MNIILKLFATSCVCLTCSAWGAHHEGGEEAAPPLFESAVLAHFNATNEKVVSLAEAFSEDGYSWRPAEGIRSVGESILHMAAANYFIGSMLGSEIPEGINPRELESTIEGKEKTLATLRASIEFARHAISHVGEADLATEMDFFGTKTSKMGLILIIGGHANEHLGQLIAYARSSGVAPPWSK